MEVTFHVLIILFMSLFVYCSTSILKSILAFGKSEVSPSFQNNVVKILLEIMFFHSELLNLNHQTT